MIMALPGEDAGDRDRGRVGLSLQETRVAGEKAENVSGDEVTLQIEGWNVTPAELARIRVKEAKRDQP